MSARATCPECGRTMMLRKDGNMASHHDDSAPSRYCQGSGRPGILPEPVTLVRVTLVLCSACLAGVGGECHTPGCALWMNRAPDVPIADHCETFKPLAEVPA